MNLAVWSGVEGEIELQEWESVSLSCGRHCGAYIV